MCCASSSKQALIASFSYHVIRQPGREDSASINQSLIPGTDTLTSDPNGLNPPPYAYTLNNATDVPGIVTNNAGAGKGPFAP